MTIVGQLGVTVFQAIYLCLFGIGIYLIVSVIKFLKSYPKNHAELVQKLDELIQVLKKENQV